ncbi:hypothetical protein AMR42_04215 [Limnothrix sp. PR1529]|uniref:hypothetical protein n=1 Tax=Limnothrix sp. PR1529 TaxID=1704291 RepID=UPI000C161FF9|nr:hypothetical protein [Limnothrix sp. PR1529]PIB14788.1 hypothetical protein AMR42_04215 [Limnothrix sp. PR1529]
MSSVLFSGLIEEQIAPITSAIAEKEGITEAQAIVAIQKAFERLIESATESPEDFYGLIANSYTARKAFNRAVS